MATCVRCGGAMDVADAAADSGEVTCTTCRQELELLLSAREETTRICPDHGVPMEKSVAHMIVIDRCPECGGVWLDPGELECLLEGMQTDRFEIHTITAILQGFTYAVEYSARFRPRLASFKSPDEDPGDDASR